MMKKVNPVCPSMINVGNSLGAAGKVRRWRKEGKEVVRSLPFVLTAADLFWRINDALVGR